LSVPRSRGRRVVGGAVVLGAVVLGAVGLAGCRPEVQFDLDGRQSQIDSVTVDATVAPDGSVRVAQHYRFASDDGGTVALPAPLVNPALPPAAQLAVGGVRDVTVDGAPATPSTDAFNPQLRVRAKEATVAYEQLGAVKRYADTAVVGLDALPSPEDASRQDPNVALSGTLTLPEGQSGPIEPHLHGGIRRRAAVAGSTVDFSSEAPIWAPTHRLDVAFPSGGVPGLTAAAIPYLETFRAEQATRDATDTATESTLADLDTQEDLSRWIVTGVAFGLPAIFWTIVVVGLVRRLRERRRVVGDVPRHLADPPTASDPAIVAVLDGEGAPSRRAVAGTILDLARRKELDIQEYGDRVVVKIPLATTGANENEQDVLDALRAGASADGTIEGTQIWTGSTRWWRRYRRDAIHRARGMGLAAKWLPLAPLSGALVTTGLGISLFFFTQPAIYFVIVFGVIVISYVISFVTGYTLTNRGWRERALWRSFARYIDDQGEIRDAVGPAGIVVWGPYLAYGAVLGEATAAARPLTP
jgi:hypothetical protein